MVRRNDKFFIPSTIKLLNTQTQCACFRVRCSVYSSFCSAFFYMGIKDGKHDLKRIYTKEFIPTQSYSERNGNEQNKTTKTRVL